MSPGQDSSVVLPPPIDAGPSPLLPRHLIDLFFRPRRFFTGQLALGKTPYAVLVAWCYGASDTLDQLDQNLLRAEFGRPRPGWDQLAPYVVDSWLGVWALLLVFGGLSGVILWWLGGWWFAIRLRWSGAPNPDRRLARLVMMYSGFVFSGPAVALAVFYTVSYGSYAEAFASDELFSVALVVFPFWSVAASYTGARAVFGVAGWRPRIWFLILPILLYVVVLGVFATLFAFFGSTPAA